jgi:hypothetical protein
MDLPRIVTVDDLDPSTLKVVGTKVVAEDPTKAPNAITAAPAAATPIATNDSVNLALNKLQAQVNAGGGGGGGQTFKQTIGDGTTQNYTVTHNLNSTDVVVTAFEISSGVNAGPGITRLSVNAVRVDFSAPIALNSHRVLVQLT